MKKFMYILFSMIMVVGLSTKAHPGTINVDVEDVGCASGSLLPKCTCDVGGDPYSIVFCSIQEAIACATTGDTISIAEGTYKELLNTCDKVLDLISGAQPPEETTIDVAELTDEDSIITLTSLSSGSTIEGLTLTGGVQYGFHCDSSGTNPVTIENCLIYENHGDSVGGIYAVNCTLTIKNSIVANNTALPGANSVGIRGINGSDITVINSILWNDLLEGQDEISISVDSSISVTYSDVQGGYAGEGNIDEDPLFEDPGNEDYHLQSTSPCIDAGCDDSENPDCAYGNEPEPNGCRVNMGAYGNIPEAQLSPDTDCDGICDPGKSGGICSESDNCPGTSNGPDGGTCSKGTNALASCINAGENTCCGDIGYCSMNQEDTDEDGTGDACDTCTDSDEDGCGNNEFSETNTGCTDSCAEDNCPETPNGPDGGTCVGGSNNGVPCSDSPQCPVGYCSKNQEDTDVDEIGDACDNCPDDSNHDQKDSDLDGLGNACDTDDDNDGVPDDGDISGNPYDYPCPTGGVGGPDPWACDDNCSNTPNGPGLGMCLKEIDGKWWSTGVTCTSSPPGGGCEVGETCDKYQNDFDVDGIGNVCDNCPGDDNSNQKDTDGDEVGDVCDNCPYVDNPNREDEDSDGKGDVCDNCPNDANSDQTDTDGDCIGDECDPLQNDYDSNQPDSDGDEVGDVCDNCPYVDNPNQEDEDSDRMGDACDNCPNHANPDQTDTDGDCLGDICDNNPDDPNIPATLVDSDSDGIGDACDNCLNTANGPNGGTCTSGNVGENCTCIDDCGKDGFCSNLHEDADGDGKGDACDNCPDTPNGPNGGTCVEDYGGVIVNSGTPCTGDGGCEGNEYCEMEQADSNDNGYGDACECYADFDGDGNVYPSDLSVFLGEYGRTDCLTTPPPCQADFDGDGNVYPSDLSIFLAEYGKEDCPTIP